MMQFITVVRNAASFHLTPCSQGMIIGPKITEHTPTLSLKQIYMSLCLHRASLVLKFFY
jgi:hypothetical protein